MTSEEAKQVIQCLKDGKIIKDTETVAGFIEFSYDAEQDVFIQYMEQVTDDLYNPDTETKSFTEAQFKKMLEKKYEFESIITFLSE